MEDIGCDGHVSKAEAELPTRGSRAGVWQAGSRAQVRLAAQEAVKRGAATARKRVEAAKMGVKKRVNSLAKYAASRANIVMALGVVVDGLRRV